MLLQAMANKWYKSLLKASTKSFDCNFHKTLVLRQTRLQEVVRIVVKCCLNRLRKKYGVLNNNNNNNNNNNGSAGKKMLG